MALGTCSAEFAYVPSSCDGTVIVNPSAMVISKVMVKLPADLSYTRPGSRLYRSLYSDGATGLLFAVLT